MEAREMVTELFEPPTQTSPARLRLSYEEYLARDDDNHLVEWVNGEVIIHMPTTNEHQDALEFLFTLLRQYVYVHQLGLVRIAPFEVKLWPGGPSREPDMFFLRGENHHRLTSKRLEGPPDLAVEIISPSSVKIDREHKFREYAQAGVPEYWIIDSRPKRERADFYALTADGNYHLFATEDDERVESKVLPGFRLNPAWLWLEEKPDVLVTLFQMSPETAVAIQKKLEMRNEK
jgi:Uma2 family endonuclease